MAENAALIVALQIVDLQLCFKKYLQNKIIFMRTLFVHWVGYSSAFYYLCVNDYHFLLQLLFSLKICDTKFRVRSLEFM